MKPEDYGLIAVAGVSSDASKYGHRIFRDLLNAGCRVKGVNPKGGFVLGQNIYKSLAELEKKPDVVITVVHPAAAEQLIEDCNKLGIPEVWLQPGSESPAALEKAKAYGIKATAGCFMVAAGIW